jgi:hypothetical protein
VSKIAKKKRKGKRTTIYGEPLRNFDGKRFTQKWRYAYKQDATRQKKRLKNRGFLVRMTKVKGGHAIWTRETPASKKYYKDIFKK